jgi:hypothetical protein
VQEGPVLLIPPQDDMAATCTITSIWSTFCRKFIPVKMDKAIATFSGSATYPYMIDEIATGHLSETLDLKHKNQQPFSYATLKT